MNKSKKRKKDCIVNVLYTTKSSFNLQLSTMRIGNNIVYIYSIYKCIR